MGKHTPGPWEVHQNAVRTVEPGRCVARMDWEIRDATDDANARLIAACPTMYDSIKARSEAGDVEATAIMETIHAAR